MSRDPLGVDPIAHVEQIKNPAFQKALKSYAQGILLKGTTVSGTITPGVPVGDDGLPLTEERRREIAAARKAYDPKKAAAGELDYAHDAPPIEPEEMGKSAQKEIDKQPDMTFVGTEELVFRKLTPEEKKELGLE